MSVFNTLLLASKIKPQPGGHDIYGTADPNATINLNINASRYSDVGTQYTVTADEYGNWGWDVPSGVTLVSLRYLLGTQYNNNPHIKTVYFDSGLDTQYLVSIDHLFTNLVSFDQGSQLTAVYGLSNIINASTNIEYLLSGCSSLTTIDDMDLWDFQSKTDLSGIFNDCSSLPINTTYASIISEFDVSLATNLSSFFRNTEIDDTTLESLNWNTTSCTNFHKFLSLTNITRFIGADSSYSSYGTYSKNTISTGNATDLSYMFEGSDILTGNSAYLSINSSSCTSFNYMFENCNFANMINSDSIDFSSAISVQGMYRNCRSLVQGYSLRIPSATTETITDASRMFENCISLTSDQRSGILLTSVPRAENLAYAYAGCTGIDYLDILVTNDTLKNCKNANNMFAGCTSLKYLNLGGLDVSNVEDFRGMFEFCTGIFTTTNYFTNWDTSSGLYFDEMFSGCENLGRGWNGTQFVSGAWSWALDGISNFYMSNARSVASMFSGCVNIQDHIEDGGGNHHSYGNYQPATTFIKDWDLSSCKNFRHMFENTGISVAYLSNWNIDLTENLGSLGECAYMFSGCTNLRDIYLNNCNMTDYDSSNSWLYESFAPSGSKIYYTTGLIPSDVQNNNTLQGVAFDDRLFHGTTTYPNAQMTIKINNNNSYIITSDSNSEFTVYDDGSLIPSDFIIHSLKNMFHGNWSIRDVYFKGLNTGHVEDMSNMFDTCGVYNVDFGKIDTSEVTDMSYMFNVTNNLNSINPPICAISLENAGNMFTSSNISRIDLSTFFTPYIQSLSNIFGFAGSNLIEIYCPGLYPINDSSSLPISNFVPNRATLTVYYGAQPSRLRNTFSNVNWDYVN